MQTRLVKGLAVLLLGALLSCTPTIYGVSQESWEMMTETQQQETVRAYEIRRQEMERARQERERVRALEEARRRAQEEEAAEIRRQRVEAIYQGRAGHYGDLVEVELKSGLAKISGEHRAFAPVIFKIADGDSREVILSERKGRTAPLRVSYVDGALLLDGTLAGTQHRAGIRLIREDSWGSGKAYSQLRSESGIKIRGLELEVRILETGRHGRGQGGRETQVIVIREQPRPAPPPKVIIVREPAQPVTPQPVVVAPPPARTPPRTRPERPRREERAVVTDPAQPAAPEPVLITPPTEQSPPTLGQEKTRPEEAKKEAQEKEAPGPLVTVLRVTLGGGKAKFGGGHEAFTATVFTLTEGETRIVPLVSRKGERMEVTASFENGALTIDPADDRKKEKVFRREPGWAKGKRYRLDSSGFAQLRGVEVRIEVLPQP